MMLNKLFYLLKPVIPRRVQISLRRKVISRQRLRSTGTWPINKRSCILPEKWAGWPKKKKFALILTHDVDTAKGQERCRNLIHLEKDLGFRSSFNFVPERYTVSPELRRYLISSGFEVGVHGLKHDGKLYKSREVFKSRATRINSYLSEWNARGFRSPAMHHNLKWLHDLNIDYDASTFDTDPFEPQSDGVGTIFPFWVQKDTEHTGYVELPYTLPQDFTLFVLMQEKNIAIWQRKLDWIVECGGMALLNVHPDYMNFNGKSLGLEEYPARFYRELLLYIKSKYEGQYWHALPQEVVQFMRKK